MRNPDHPRNELSFSATIHVSLQASLEGQMRPNILFDLDKVSSLCKIRKGEGLKISRLSTNGFRTASISEEYSVRMAAQYSAKMTIWHAFVCSFQFIRDCLRVLKLYLQCDSVSLRFVLQTDMLPDLGVLSRQERRWTVILHTSREKTLNSHAATLGSQLKEA